MPVEYCYWSLDILGYLALSAGQQTFDFDLQLQTFKPKTVDYPLTKLLVLSKIRNSQSVTYIFRYSDD